MKTLSEVDLMEVTGGKVPNASLGVTGTSSSNNDAILASLNSIQNSIKDIGKNNNNGLFGGNAGLMFAIDMLAYKEIAGGSVRKLVAKNGVPDAGCAVCGGGLPTTN